ncbi:MAG: hypothetical protein KU29_12745 [Sulfurovum sp. FS06-10]|nr:MAG: hypothetical protein KU29_12745 [Sulfurovum sp. FS06-10]
MKKMTQLLMLIFISFTILGCYLDDDNTYPSSTNTQTPTPVIEGSNTVNNSIPIPTPTPSTSSKNVLILYDTVGDFGNTGKTNALFLQNLLGHFDINIQAKPAIEYVANEMDEDEAVFYIGNTYNVLASYTDGSAEKNAYENFYRDIGTKDKSIIWINYNLASLEKFWKDNNLNNTTFEQKTGLSFNRIAQLKYNRVKYKNIELFKGVIPFSSPGAYNTGCIDEGNTQYACSLELNLIDIVDANKTEIFATTYSTIAGTTTPISPYITRGDKFWFVGDIPFSFISEEDRYLAFADVLHDMLGIPHTESHKAIIRIEDVDARTEITKFTLLTDFMHQENLPFSIATIPQYEDPLGLENKGVATREKISDSQIGTVLKGLYDEGIASIVQHGTTHEYYNSINDSESEIKNPYNGLSGNDFEFIRVIENADHSYSYLYPVQEDSPQWAKDRIMQGKDILSELGITPFAWEPPHYMAGPNQYRGVQEIYPIQYARVLYYPNEESNDTATKYKSVGQFFPFVIQHDVYGYTIVPENIQNIVHNPNTDYRPLLPSDTIRFAQKLKVVRDGVASFYYHPHLGTDELKEITDGLKNAGYTFVPAPSLIE